MRNITNGYLTVKEVAEIFDLSVQTVYKWIREGLKCYKVSKHRTRIRPAKLLEYFKKRGNSEWKIWQFSKEIESYFKQEKDYRKYPFQDLSIS